MPFLSPNCSTNFGEPFTAQEFAAGDELVSKRISLQDADRQLRETFASASVDEPHLQKEYKWSIPQDLNGQRALPDHPALGGT